MSVGQVVRRGGWVNVETDARLEGRTAPAEPVLSIAELRQWLKDSPDARPVLLSRGHRRLRRSIEVLRRRLERFNRGVPAGLEVQLNPELVGLLAQAPLCES